MKLTPLQKAVIKQLGYDKLTDNCLSTLNGVCNCGADAGFDGFIYHRDTVEFYQENRAEILTLLEDTAESLGEDMLSMIASFNCLKSLELKASDIGRIIWGRNEHDDSVQVKNALAWFALEETAREMCQP